MASQSDDGQGQQNTCTLQTFLSAGTQWNTCTVRGEGSSAVVVKDTSCCACTPVGAMNTLRLAQSHRLAGQTKQAKQARPDTIPFPI